MIPVALSWLPAAITGLWLAGDVSEASSWLLSRLTNHLKFGMGLPVWASFTTRLMTELAWVGEARAGVAGADVSSPNAIATRTKARQA
jgi:hypothetical protein